MTPGDDKTAPVAGLAPAPSEPARLDHTVLATLRGMGRPGSGGALPRLLPLFLTTAISQIAALHGALAADDFPAIHTTAHTMKSSCGSIGAARLARMCETLESACDTRRGARPEAGHLRGHLRALIGAIEQEYTCVAEELRAVLAARD